MRDAPDIAPITATDLRRTHIDLHRFGGEFIGGAAPVSEPGPASLAGGYFEAAPTADPACAASGTLTYVQRDT